MVDEQIFKLLSGVASQGLDTISGASVPDGQPLSRFEGQGEAGSKAGTLKHPGFYASRRKPERRSQLAEVNFAGHPQIIREKRSGL